MTGFGDAEQEAGHFHDEAALWRIFFEENRDGIVVLRGDGSVFCANDRFAAMEFPGFRGHFDESETIAGGNKCPRNQRPALFGANTSSSNPTRKSTAFK